MNEKELLKTLDPLITALASMQKQLNLLEQKPGPKGEDADPEAVAEILAKDYLDLLKGAPGQDAQAVDMDELAAKLVDDPVFQKLCKGDPGDDGESVTPEMVVELLIKNHADQLKGEPGQSPVVHVQQLCDELCEREDFLHKIKGEPGESVDPEVVADLVYEKYAERLKGQDGITPEVPIHSVRDSLLESKAFTTLTKGEKGKDADPVEVAQILIRDYRDILKGEKGKDGETPEITLEDVRDTLLESDDFIALVKGSDGKDADAKEVAKHIFDFYKQELKGEKGEKGDPGESIELNAVVHNLMGNPEFLERVKGDKGDSGPEGGVGKGIDVPLWRAGVYRKNTVVQHEFGRYYCAVKDTASEPGKTPEWERIGSGGFAWKGIKNESEVYEDGDFFIDNGTTFLYLNGKGHMFAKRGRDGKDGVQGVQGVQGEKGDRGQRGARGEKGDAAPHIVTMQFDTNQLALVLSDGEVLEGECKGMEEYVFSIAEQAAISAVKAVEENANKLGTPIKLFKDIFQSGTQYKAGDLVNFNHSLYLCRKGGRFTELNDQWTKIAGFGSSISQSAINKAVSNALASVDAVAWDKAYTSGDAVSKNTMVNDNGWLMISNKDTSEPASPSVSGPLDYLADALPQDETDVAWVKGSESLRFLWVGTHYELPFDYVVTHVRLFINDVSGNISYDLFMLDKTGGMEKVTPIVANFPANTIGWYDVPVGQIIIPANSVVEFIMQKTSLTTGSSSSGQWTYRNTTGMPLVGEMRINGSHVYINQTDSALANRATDLNNVVSGSTIGTGGVLWEVQNVVFTPGAGADGIYDFTVSPVAALNNNTLYTLQFTNYSAYLMPIWYVTDFYAAISNVDGLIRRDDGAVVYENNGYSVDIQYQQISKSADWDIMSASDIVAPNIDSAIQFPGTPSGGTPAVNYDLHDPTVRSGDLHMAGHSIVDLADPRSGAAGAKDAVNRETLERAIAQGTLYKGLFHPASNTPDLRAIVDSDYKPPIAGQSISKPTGAPNPGAGKIMVWFKGDPTFTFPIKLPYSITGHGWLSDGTMLTYTMPPTQFSNAAALTNYLTQQVAAQFPQISRYVIYQTGGVTWIGIETYAPVYATYIEPYNGGGFGVAQAGANNLAMQGFFWTVETDDPNQPEPVPPGLPGLDHGEEVNNGDQLIWNDTLKEFEILRGSAVTKSWSEETFLMRDGSNIDWAGENYSERSIVLWDNNLWRATRNVAIGEPPPDIHNSAWELIGGYSGNTMFTGMGAYDESDTSALNNWGMPPSALPSNKEPVDGDVYIDIGTDSITFLTVTSQPDLFDISGTVDKMVNTNLGMMIASNSSISFPGLLDFNKDGVANNYAKNSFFTLTFNTPSITPQQGYFAGQTFTAGQYLVIWSGDPLADNHGWAVVPDTNPAPWTLHTNTPQKQPSIITVNTIKGPRQRYVYETPATIPAAPTYLNILGEIPLTSALYKVVICDQDPEGSVYSFEFATSDGPNARIVMMPLIVNSQNSFIQEIAINKESNKVYIGALFDQGTPRKLYDVYIETEHGSLQDVVCDNTSETLQTPAVGLSINGKMDRSGTGGGTGSGSTAGGTTIVADFAALNNLNAADGEFAYVTQYGTSYLRVQGAWQPFTPWRADESTIIAATGSGFPLWQIAIATDTGRAYIWGGTIWFGSPVEHFATDADLLAATAYDGMIAFTDDTGTVYARAGGNWIKATSSHSFYGGNKPSNPSLGDMFFNPDDILEVFDGTNWITRSSVVSTAPPANPYKGMIWHETNSNSTKIWDANSWNDISTPVIIQDDMPDVNAPNSEIEEGRIWLSRKDGNQILRLYENGAWRGFGAVDSYTIVDGTSQASGDYDMGPLLAYSYDYIEISGWIVSHTADPVIQIQFLDIGLQDIPVADDFGFLILQKGQAEMYSGKPIGTAQAHSGYASDDNHVAIFPGVLNKPVSFKVCVYSPSEAYPMFEFDAQGISHWTSSSSSTPNFQNWKGSGMIETSFKVGGIVLNINHQFDGRVFARAHSYR